MLLVSPAEPKVLYPLGEVSSLPESYGADFLFACSHGLVGIQRKEVRDLIASVRGDRIARELGQSTALHKMVLLIEGDWDWAANGQSMRVDGFNRAQYDGLLLSFQEAGWWVVFSESIVETPAVLARVQSWFAKEHHGSLAQRPKSGAPWGNARNRDWAVHLWQSFDGIGVTVAGALYDALGVPLEWTVSEAELLAVPGIGKVRARALLDALDRGEKLDVRTTRESV